LLLSLGDVQDGTCGYARLACRALECVPPSQMREVLADVADFCVERAY
jgi:octaprenyl-diphosphate synthase